MKRMVRRILFLFLLVAAAGIAADLFVPASRPALRVALERVGLGQAADRLAKLAAEHPTDRAGTPGEVKEATAPLPPAITVIKTATRPFRDQLFVSGTLVAREEAMVGPQIDGVRITDVLAEDGDHVEKGQILARLDRSQLDALQAESDAALARADAAMAQAQNAIAQFAASDTQAQADYQRSKRLDAGVMSQAALDQRASAARSSEAQLAGARSALAVAAADKRSQEAQRRELDVRVARTEVRAPVAGIVSRRTARLGALANSGADALYRIIEDGAIDLDAEAPDNVLARTRLGMKAAVDVAGAGTTVKGSVRLISSEVDKATRLGRVRIALEGDAAGRIGSFATAVIDIAHRDSIGVPTSAVTGQDGIWSVEVVGQGDRIERRSVETGLTADNEIEIRNGLKTGETVVARAAAFLRAGDIIRPLAADQEASR